MQRACSPVSPFGQWNLYCQTIEGTVANSPWQKSGCYSSGMEDGWKPFEDHQSKEKAYNLQRNRRIKLLATMPLTYIVAKAKAGLDSPVTGGWSDTSELSFTKRSEDTVLLVIPRWLASFLAPSWCYLWSHAASFLRSMRKWLIPSPGRNSLEGGAAFRKPTDICASEPPGSGRGSSSDFPMCRALCICLSSFPLSTPVLDRPLAHPFTSLSASAPPLAS